MLRTASILVALTATASPALAQPVDPYDPPVVPPSGPAQPIGTPPQPAPQDPVLAEQIAQSLVARAQELLDARVFLDAKQLAVEAVVTSPKGPSADHARMIIKAVNQQLGIKDEEPKTEPVDTSPITDPTAPLPQPITPPVESGPRWPIAATVHGGMFGGVLGAMIGTFVSSDGEKQAGAAVALGLGGAVAGGFLAPKRVEKLGWNEAQVRTAGAGTVWGGTIGAFIGDIGTGLQGTSGRQILISAGIGSVVGGVAGGAYASRDKLNKGDVALVDTFAGIGTAGGLTLGMLMQPAQSEAYSLNAVIGCAGGVLAGLVAAPETNTTQRRMLYVAGAAALGGAIPFLLYLGVRDDSTTSDEQVIGLLSTGGLVGGAYLGFRYTRGMDDGLDTKSGKPEEDAPPAALTRNSSGEWNLGTIAPHALSRTLDDRQRGTAFTLLGGAF